MTPDPREIAKVLSDAQRRRLLAIGDGQPIEFALGRSGFSLIARGLAVVNDLGARHLTDAGLAVRAVLMEGRDG